MQREYSRRDSDAPPRPWWHSVALGLMVGLVAMYLVLAFSDWLPDFDWN